MVMVPRFGMQNGSLARQAYQSVNVQTASPGQILLRLYEGAIRFTKQAKEAIEAGDPAEKGKYISKTMAIIDEFIAALDHDQAPELCANLEQLYLFMIDQLSAANSTMNVEPLDLVLQHLNTLYDAWKQAVSETGG